MKPAPMLPGLATAPLISDWVLPQPDGTLHLRSGRAELGQGVGAAFARIAAAELDLPIGRIRILGPDTAAGPDEGFTAGSLSMTQGGAALRAATSALRALCLEEAARRLGRDCGTLEIANGAILCNGAATGLTLTALARQIDLDRPVADHAGPKPAGARHLDALPDRRDLTAHLTGAPFLHDLAPEGLLHGRVLHPPHATATLAEAFDAAALRARPGIVAVVRDGTFLGLVAETEARAEAARAWAEARLRWDVPPIAETDPFAAMDRSNAPMEPLEGTETPLPDRAPDIDRTARRGFISHGSIGPSVAIAEWRDGHLHVRSHTQGVHPLRRALAMALKLDAAAIRVTHVPGAGCYGHNGADDAAYEAALLARAVPGRPVRLRWTRRDDFATAPVGAAMSTRTRVWTDDAGRIAAMALSVTSPPHSTRPGTAGAPCFFSAQLLSDPIPLPEPPDIPAARGGGAARNAMPLYALGAAQVSRKLVTGLPWRTSSLRALGAYLNVYAIETAVEAAALAADTDPFDYRLAHLDDPRAAAVLERLREISAPHRDQDDWGIALARYKNKAAWAGVFARVALEDALRVTRLCIAVDMGEVVSPDGACNQIEGGAIQALSWALMEKVDLDGPAIATAAWDDYPILRFSQVPPIDIALIDRPDDPPLGVAEVVQGPVAAAVGNALQRLTGAAFPELPLRREAIVAALSA